MKFKHFPTGLLRCGISKRKAKLFVTALMVAATSQTCFAQNAIEGVQDLVGKTITELRSGTTDVEKYPHEDQTKIFFLYNVKTGQFFNAGGYWGTEGTMRDYPLKLWAKDPGSGDNTIRFAMELKTNQGQYIKWAGGDKDLDYGVFIDRFIKKEYSSDDWFFTDPIDGKNTYKIYTKKYNKWNTSLLDTPYYMCVCGDIVDVKTSDEITKSYAGYDEWRIFSMDQIVALQQENLDNMKNSLELSFKLKCAGFSRGDNELNSWKMYPWGLGTEAIARFGLEHLYDYPTLVANQTKPITLDRATELLVDDLSKSNTYSFKYDNTTTTTDKTFSEKDDYQRYLGKYFCADVKNVRGIIYQDVEIKDNGVYVVECKGYSNTEKAKLFATIVTMGADGKWTDTGDGQIRSTVLSQISHMPAAEQTALHTSEKNMDYAGQNFYNSRKYINNVLVNVEGVEGADKTRKAIRFGIMVGSKDDANPDDGEWTVFDDFRLLFANKFADEDLVLDEDRDDLKYLQHETTYRNRTLHLNKTLMKDKWNSLVLPVDLTIDQFRNAFGANARLAKLTKLAANEIMFESDKTLDDLVTTTDKNTIVLKAYTPYIIFPTKDLSNETNHMYTVKLRKKTNGGSDASNFENVTIKANHIQIPNVTMKYKQEGSVLVNDLTNMNTTNWTSTLNTGDGTITAYGTFARTFGEAKQNDKGEWVYTKKDNILANRDNLIGSYFFYEGNMYYSDKRARGLRGFSCWFKPNTPGTKATLFLDGVQQEGGLTDIGEITFEPQNESMERFANGIYNMNGQLVKAGTSMAGMPKGIYIVNGKKVVVR